MRCFAVFLSVLAALSVLLRPHWLYAEGACLVTDYWPPFVTAGDNGELGGIDIDLMRAAGRQMGVDFSIEQAPWTACLTHMEKGSRDFITGVAKSREREGYIIYSELPYYSCRPAFYSVKGSRVAVEKFADLKAYRIGFTLNSVYFPEFDEDTSLNKFGVNSEAELLDMLVAGHLDLIVGTDCQVEYDIARRQLSGRIRKEAYQPDYRIDLYIGASARSRWRERMGELSAVLIKMLQNGTVDRISSRYFEKSRSTPASSD
ncbi:substrate-binding periplasmic protein [Maridesulfovibrio sp. FT414]|uniref:substrate-binding periplasmic protein n=1 Tax=Maridesulfovibrio sp. FT414 TaxID=2979469 RepID=UPI003D802019